MKKLLSIASFLFGAFMLVVFAIAGSQLDEPLLKVAVFLVGVVLLVIGVKGIAR